jgi:RNA polymerase sigma-70 factor (ECF subfamily)
MRAEEAQLTAQYRAAIATLPAEQRDTFLLYESGLSLEEVGSVTAVSPETAKSRLRYAVAKLRISLAPAKESYTSGAGVIQEPGV